MILLEAIYDLKVLYVLRKNCYLYIHGHSAGGTNPSLVEAMFFGVPVFTYDVVYNRETTLNKANYFKNVSDLFHLINSDSSTLEQNAKAMLEIANKNYKWATIIKAYEKLYQ